MIEARHIGELFSIMRSTYGHLWPHNSAEDAAIWLRKLGGYSRAEIMQAAASASSRYPDHPPTLGQFEISVTGTSGREWVKTTMIEDKREPGRMPFDEWKKPNGVSDD